MARLISLYHLRLQVGDVVEGTVATIQPYGAFVNIGPELNGLLHISQISHDRISSVEQVLEIGQKLKVRSGPPSCQCTPPSKLFKGCALMRDSQLLTRCWRLQCRRDQQQAPSASAAVSPRG